MDLKAQLDSKLDEQVDESEKLLAHIWKTTLFRGLLGIAFAIVVLVWPNIGLATMIALVAAFAIVSGVATLVGAFRLPVERGQKWWLGFEGVVAIAVGVAIIVWPDLSAVALLYVIGAWAIVAGVFQIMLAFGLPFKGGRSVLLLLGGLLTIAFGVIMFARPGAGAIALLALVAAFALVTGIVQVVWAFELRKASGELKESYRPKPTSTTKPVTHS